MKEFEKLNMIEQVTKLNALNDMAALKMPSSINPDPTITRNLARLSLEKFQKLVENNKTKAKKNNNPIEIDGSELSGVKGGADIWSVNPDGSLSRKYKAVPEVVDLIEMRRTERVAEPNKPVNIETIYEIIRLAHRAPNATNEQPSRVLIYTQDHPAMNKIGIAMNEALNDIIVPQINLKYYILHAKKENNDFLKKYTLEQISSMTDEEIAKFEDMPAPLHDLPRTRNSLISRGKLLIENARYYNCREKNDKVIKLKEYTLKDMVRADKVFAQGMGRFFLKFKNTHPVLLVVLRQVRYTSGMTEALEKYGIKLPDVGEAHIDAGIFTDHLALATRGLGLSGVIKTGPLDLAADKIASIFIEDLNNQSEQVKKLMKKNMDNNALEIEYHKLISLRDGLKVGLEHYYARHNHQKITPEVKKQIFMGKGYFPATFFQLGHPLSDPGERVMDPRQGRNPVNNMLVYMSYV